VIRALGPGETKPWRGDLHGQTRATVGTGPALSSGSTSSGAWSIYGWRRPTVARRKWRGRAGV